MARSDAQVVAAFLRMTGWSKYRAAQEIGVTEKTMAALARGESPLRRYHKLAMAALLVGLEPFEGDPEMDASGLRPEDGAELSGRIGVMLKELPPAACARIMGAVVCGLLPDIEDAHPGAIVRWLEAVANDPDVARRLMRGVNLGGMPPQGRA